MDDDQRYQAAASKDARFDGGFITAVRTTGVYCRPSCPAMTPKRRNVTFHPSAAAAQLAGYTVLRFTHADVPRRPHQVATQIRHALIRADV